MQIKPLEYEFEKLTSSISRLIEHKLEAQKYFNEQNKQIHEFHQQLPEWHKRENLKSYPLHYKSPSLGTELLGPPRTHLLEDDLELNFLQKIRSYNWVLAEAYEAFERFLIFSYAYCGLNRLDIWRAPTKWAHENSDNILHYNTARAPYGQLLEFRRNSHHFKTYETKNSTGTNYKVIIVLIEKLRHITVHSEGRKDNLSSLINKVQSQLKDENPKEIQEYINSYFLPYNGTHLIDLLEYPSDDIPGAHHDYLHGFLRALVEYGKLIFESIETHPSNHIKATARITKNIKYPPDT